MLYLNTIGAMESWEIIKISDKSLLRGISKHNKQTINDSVRKKYNFTIKVLC